MAFMRPRSRVTLHSGGATVRNKRVTGVKGSERDTAPGKDTRDIGPDKGTRKCRACSKPIGRPRAAHCDSCLADQQLVKAVRAELKRLGLPRLGAAAAKGSPMWKKRKQTEAACRGWARVRPLPAHARARRRRPRNPRRRSKN